MGGESKQSTTQNSTTAPWAAAQPALQGMLSQLQGNLGNTGVTGAESGALGTLQANGANAASMWGPQIANYAQTLLGGGGATDRVGVILGGEGVGVGGGDVVGEGFGHSSPPTKLDSTSQTFPTNT